MALRVIVVSLLASLVLFGAGSHLIAQYSPGDLIVVPGATVGTMTRLIGVTPLGSVYTLNAPSISGVFGILNAPDNRGVWICGGGPSKPSAVYELAPDGRFTTVTSAPIRPFGMDEEGGLLGAGINVGLLKVRRGNQITTFYAPIVNGLAGGVDLLTGEPIMDWGGTIFGITRAGAPRLTTVWSKPPGSPLLFGQIHYDPTTDLMVAPSGTSLSALAVRGRPGAVPLATFAMKLSHGAQFEPAWRAVILSFNSQLAAGNCVELFDLATLTTVGTFVAGSATAPITAYGAVRARTRHLCAISPALRGSTYTCLVSFPNEPNTPYVVGFSFGLRPGIPVARGRTIHLRRDPLLMASVTNSGIFRGCQGVLDKQGEAIAQVSIPRNLPLKGVRFFGAAVTISGGQIRSVSAPIGVTIQ